MPTIVSVQNFLSEEFPPLVVDIVFVPYNAKYQKHTFVHTNFLEVQIIVLI